jgi:hypothetical protein
MFDLLASEHRELGNDRRHRVEDRSIHPEAESSDGQLDPPGGSIARPAHGALGNPGAERVHRVQDRLVDCNHNDEGLR